MSAQVETPSACRHGLFRRETRRDPIHVRRTKISIRSRELVRSIPTLKRAIGAFRRIRTDEKIRTDRTTEILFSLLLGIDINSKTW
jgi:hypothetical protein